MNKIDVYDFDKTLYKKDSTIQLYLFCLRRKWTIIKYLLFQIISLIIFKITRKDKYKENFFVFLKDFDEIHDIISDFWDKNENEIRKDLLYEKNYKIVISASPEFLLNEICNRMGIDKLIATKVNPKSGKFESKNCYGREKLSRLDNEVKDYRIENFYSDSKSDIFLAKVARNAYIVKKEKVCKWNIEE